MRFAGLSLTAFVLIASATLACSSSPSADPPATDAGVEASSEPPVVTPEEDAGQPDVRRPNVEPAPRLAVECAQDPCYVAVSGNGGEHVCGLLKDGTVRCWGRDTRARAAVPSDGGAAETDGALGRGHAVSAIEGATPAPVVGLAGVKQVSVGRNLGTCALTEDGAVYCWGRNEFGQLGRPPTEARVPVPARIEGLPPAAAVALGSTIGCAVAAADGALWCWGARAHKLSGLLGPSEEATFAPQVMPAFKAPVRELVIGSSRATSDPYFGPLPDYDTITALLEGGVLATFGDLPAGASSVTSPTAPTEVHGVVRIGTFGYLEQSGILSRWVPNQRALYIPNAAAVVDVAITAATDYGPVPPTKYVEQAGVLLATGRLYRWGRNISGALGYATDVVDIADEPLDMTHVAGDRVVSFAMTAASTCVSLVNGTVKCWGSNQRGELGRGTVDPAQHPEAELIR